MIKKKIVIIIYDYCDNYYDYYDYCDDYDDYYCNDYCDYCDYDYCDDYCDYYDYCDDHKRERF